MAFTFAPSKKILPIANLAQRARLVPCGRTLFFRSEKSWIPSGAKWGWTCGQLLPERQRQVSSTMHEQRVSMPLLDYRTVLPVRVTGSGELVVEQLAYREQAERLLVLA